MTKVLELVGGPPASGKSTYIRREYAMANRADFAHLDYDAMVVKEAMGNRGGFSENDVRDHVSMVYGKDRAALMWGGG